MAGCEPKVDPNEVFQRIQDLAKFARSVLHWSFPDLDKVNPSFSVIASTCELLITILRGEEHTGSEDAQSVAEFMRDIAQAIVDRDDKALIDIMAQLDEYLEMSSSKASLAAV
ncbi:hypothetical protein [Aliivibrio fischeri]|uniref:hypothetical protein n=1 Tax=Aliivibrio fischeri TaxID=668 RepID=UPI001A301EE7